ncbi:hypothetical protein H6G51_00720 [Limnothrix sp. FACHB-708]|uniref:hypothetical protein n=1 Tax=unclassified Limnothrix TaxID=2632864 RepID=UPI001687E5A1|nr:MULTISPECIES: hypothetical protein [unclassified Limnothrix]MBD2551790.1 hypothetical protein [Limnothrix sp. FACHB-708]MBD2589469.1 hypothetical protein [Limnothrix sp. FACHB-406]
MQIKDLTIEEFTDLFKSLLRETIQEVLAEMLTDSEANLPLKSGLAEALLQQRDRRQSGQTTPLSTEQVMARLGLDQP